MPDFSDLEIAKADCDEIVHVECNTSISVIGNTLDGYTLISSVDMKPNISDNKSIEEELKPMSTSDDNADTVLPSSTTPTFTDATPTITYTDSENNSSTNRINIGSTNIIHFEEVKIGNHHELEFDSLEHMLPEKMGSNCLRTWNSLLGSTESVPQQGETIGL
jgi:hypothetical protein